MRNINLGFFEKIYINLRCRKDWKNKRFCDFYTGLSLSRSRFSRFRTNGELATEATDIHYSDDHDKDSSESTILVVSPFVTAELGQFIAKRDNILAKKLCVIKYSKDNTIQHKILKFPDAIAFLDDQIRIVEGDIACLEAEYQATISSFQEKYDYNIVHGDARLATASIKGAHVRRDKYRAAKKLKYDALIMLLSEKIRIINVVNAHINVFKTWRFSRIRYYYSLACTWTMRLPVSVYSDTDFDIIAKQKFEQEYTGELESSKTTFDQLKKEIEFPSEDTILEKSPEEIMALRSIAIMKENNEAHLKAASAAKGEEMGLENASSDIKDVFEEAEESIPKSTEIDENINSEGSSATVTDNLGEEVEVIEDLNPEKPEDKAIEKTSVDEDEESDKEDVSDSASTGVMDSEVPSIIIKEDESKEMTGSDSTSTKNVEVMDSEVLSTFFANNNIEDTTDDSSSIERAKILQPDTSSVTEDAEVNVDVASSNRFKENLNLDEPYTTVADNVPDEMNRRDAAITESAEDMYFDEIFKDVSDKETTEVEAEKTKNSESFDSDTLSSTNIYNEEEESEERASDETAIASGFVDGEAAISDFASTEAVEGMNFDEIFDAIADIAEGEIDRPEVDNIEVVEFTDADESSAAELQEETDSAASTITVAGDAAEEVSESVPEDTEPEEEKLFDERFTEIAANAEETESSDVTATEVPEETDSEETSTTAAEEMNESVSEDTEPEEEKLFDERFTEIAANAEETESSDVTDVEVPEETDSEETSTTAAEEVSESVFKDTEPEEEKLFDERFTEIAANAEETESSDVTATEVPEETDSEETSTTAAEEMNESVSEDTEPEEEKLFDELFTEIAANAEEAESSDVADAEVPKEADSDEFSTPVANDAAEEMSESASEDTEPEKEKLLDELFTEIAASVEEVEFPEVYGVKIEENLDSDESSTTSIDKTAEEAKVIEGENTVIADDMDFGEIFNAIAGVADIDTE